MDSYKFCIDKKKIKTMKVYLSGAMEFAEDEGADWRNKMTLWLKKNINHTSFDPVINSAKLIENENAQNYRKWKISNIDRYSNFIRTCVRQDIHIVKNEIDYLICLWDKNVLKGAGTHAEVTIAFDSNKPVYLVNKLSKKDLSGWIMACSTKIFNDFDSLKLFLLKKYHSNA